MVGPVGTCGGRVDGVDGQGSAQDLDCRMDGWLIWNAKLAARRTYRRTARPPTSHLTTSAARAIARCVWAAQGLAVMIGTRVLIA